VHGRVDPHGRQIRVLAGDTALMSESCGNDGRVWVPARAGRPPGSGRHSPRTSATNYLERSIRRSGNLVARTCVARGRRYVLPNEGRGVGPGGLGVYLDFADAIGRLGARRSRPYGNLFEM